MTAEIPSLTTQHATLPVVRPEYSILETSRAELETGVDRAQDRTESVYEAATPEIQAKIDAFQERFYAAAKSAEEQGEPEPDLAAILRASTDLPEDFKLAALEYHDRSTKLLSVESELEGHAGEKAADMVRSLAELEDHIDYARLVELTLGKAPSDASPEGSMKLADLNVLYNVTRMIRLRQLLQTDYVPTYHQLTGVEVKLTEYVSDWRARGLITEEQLDQPAGPALNGEALPALEDQIRQAYAIQERYRHYDNSMHVQGQAVTSFVRTFGLEASETRQADSVDDVFMYNRLALNDKLSAALNNKLQALVRNLSPQDFELDTSSPAYKELTATARNIDPIEALNAMEVSGTFDSLPFGFTAEDLKKFLLTLAPPIALQSVKRVVFRALSLEEESEEGTFTLGFKHWSEEVEGTEIVISDVRVRERHEQYLKLYADQDNAKALADYATREYMMETISHEFAHALHEALPAGALQRWRSRVEADKTHVSAYAEHYHKIDHKNRDKEEFADSVAMFTEKPEVLSIISPARYAALEELYDEFMPFYSQVMKQVQADSIAIARKAWSQKGVTDEMILGWHLDDLERGKFAPQAKPT
jgi:hypothetical protein